MLLKRSDYAYLTIECILCKPVNKCNRFNIDINKRLAD